jgi:hypothetical protein
MAFQASGESSSSLAKASQKFYKRISCIFSFLHHFSIINLVRVRIHVHNMHPNLTHLYQHSSLISNILHNNLLGFFFVKEHLYVEMLLRLCFRILKFFRSTSGRRPSGESRPTSSANFSRKVRPFLIISSWL